MALESVNVATERLATSRAQLRRNSLSAWLDLLQILDHHRDPDFEPEDVPERIVQPPPTSEGVVYRPGVDPAKIDDPQARAEYEKAIAANRAKANNYRLQIHLGRLNERITPRAEEFIRSAYTSDPHDQQELKTAINSTIKDPRRKASLLELLKTLRP